MMNKAKKTTYVNEMKEFFFMHKILPSLPSQSWLGINLTKFTHDMGGNKYMYNKDNTYNVLK